MFERVVLEKTLESPLDCKEIQPVHSKGDQSWVFIGSTDVEAETPILWPPHAKSWLIGKDPDAGKDSGPEEKGTTEDEIVGWHHQHNGHGFGWTLGVGDGQGGLACCSSWSCKESDMTERVNWTARIWEKGNSHCSWGCKLMNPLMKTIWKFLKLKIELPYDSAIPFMGIYQERIRTVIWKGTYTPMFIAEAFTITKTWRQPKCPLTIGLKWCVCVYLYICIF